MSLKTVRKLIGIARTSTTLTKSSLLAANRPSARCFSSYHACQLAVAEMSDRELASIRVNPDRLMKTIHESCEFGKGERWGEAPTETGMSRLSLSDSDKQVRDWFAKTMQDLDCTVTTDSMGNQFAVRPGQQAGPPTYVGSHLDTQPTGGRYDGILGVCAGIEMLRALDDHWIETSHPVGVVNWTNEEGARFPMSMVSSGVWAGSIPLQKAHNTKSVIPSNDTATMRSELERIGYLGQTECSYNATPMAAHFELHIEQGPILEAEQRQIGVVRGVQAYKWYTVTVKGRDSHTGATSFAHRADALLTASKMILASHRIAARHNALASTGILNLRPGSTNTVPGFVRFSLDIRSPEDAVVDAVEAQCRTAFEAIAAGEDTEGVNNGCVPSSLRTDVEWQTDFVSSATVFHADCIQCVSDAGRDLFGSADVSSDGNLGSWGKMMTSGAGHDSVYTSKRAPTCMIFVPCREGISHNPREYCSPTDCGNGAQVLTGAVLRYDKLRSDRSR